MTRYLTPLFVALLLVAATGPALAAVEGSPDLSVHLPDNRVAPGEETSLGLFLLNEGDIRTGGSPNAEARVTTARDVTVTVTAGSAPIELRTATQPVGSVPEGRVGPIQFAVSVDEDAAPGTYEVPVEVDYVYTSEIESDPDDPDHTTRSRTVRRTVTLVVEERARFAVLGAATDAYVGERGDVSLTLENVGSATASDARVNLRSDDSALTFDGTASASGFVGDWSPGEIRTVTVSGAIAPGAGGRALPVVATVAYEDDDGTSRQSEPLSAGVTPTAGASRFPVVNATADVAVGERGTVSVVVRNAGTDAVEDATVTVSSADPVLTLGGSRTASTFAGAWAPGEVRTFELAAAVAEGADARPYPLSVSVEYRTTAGETRTSSATTAGIEPRTEQSFGLEDVSSTLVVGDEGTLEGVVRNTGETTVRNAVVVFSADNSNIVPVETEFAVGDLAPGESATFAFDAEVTSSADAGPRQVSLVVRYRDGDDDVRRSDPLDARVVSLVVRYRDGDDDVRRSDPLDARVDVGPRADVFTVEPVSASFSPGASGVLELRVTNDGEEAVSDVSAKLFVDDPLASDDDEAFIDVLGPGESTVVRFSLSAAGSAVEGKVYPVSLDFQYEDAEGDTRLSDSYDVPVRVVERQGGDGPSTTLIGGAVVAVVVLIGGLVLWRRR